MAGDGSLGAHDPAGCAAPATTPAGPASALNVGCSAQARRAPGGARSRRSCSARASARRSIGQSRGGSFARCSPSCGRTSWRASSRSAPSHSTCSTCTRSCARSVEAVASWAARRARPLQPQLPQAATAARASGSLHDGRCRAAWASPPSTRAATASSTGAPPRPRRGRARGDPLEPLRHGREPGRLPAIADALKPFRRRSSKPGARRRARLRRVA